MLPKSKMDMGMPIGFKIWFGFVAFIALTIFASTVYFLGLIVQAGPEGIGRQVGSFVKGVKDASQ